MQSLIHMAGGIALLLWGAYMVKTGMLRTFGVALKDFLSVRLKNRAIAMASGTTLASLLQSSTAATLIVASIQAEGFLTTNMAFATILGADFGSALMTRVLTFDLSFLSPLLIFIGTCLFFMRKADTRQGQFGRILIGLGIIMLAPHFVFGHATKAGWAMIIFAFVIMVLTAQFTIWLGRRMGVDDRHAGDIAGALATGDPHVTAILMPMLKAKGGQVINALACVLLFGLIASFLLRWLEKRMDGSSDYKLAQTDHLTMAAGTYSHPDRGTPFDERSKEYRDRVRQELQHGRTRGDR